MKSDTTEYSKCEDTNGLSLQEIPILDQNEEMSVVSTLPQFSDDDYIVFTFGEEVEIQMIEDENMLESEHFDRVKKCARRRINRKLLNIDATEELEAIYKSNCDHRLIGDERNTRQTNEGETGKISSEKDKVQLSSIRSDIAIVPIVTPTDDIGSHGSTSSFAFPELNKEGLGSLVRMPKPNNMLQLRRPNRKIWPTT